MKIAITGDVMLGRLVNEALRREPPAYPWGDTLPALLSADLRLINLECVISDLGEPWSETPKTFHFRSDAKNIATLTAAQIDLVSLANNHALDHGREAMLDMLARLDEAGIGHAGAGRDRAAACAPTFVERAGLRLGHLSFTDNMPEWEATDERAGVLWASTNRTRPETQALLDLVEETSAACDLLIVSAHWGGNWGHFPPEAHVFLGEALIDRGADLIHGHSCHVVRGIAFHRGRPILHSCGDYVDDYAVHLHERNDHSFLFFADVDDSGAIERLRLVPTLIDQFQARLAPGAAREAIVQRMSHLCERLNTPVEWNEAAGELLVPAVNHR